MTLEDFNQLPAGELQVQLNKCCGSQRWVELLMRKGPFADVHALIRHAQSVWYSECKEEDWLEAFTHHPRIGDKKNINEKAKSTIHLATGEQAGVEEKDAGLIEKLHAANKAYEARFGFTFIVCATGKSGNEMLHLLEDRIKNTSQEEVHIAMGEQCKITQLRLQKLLDEVLFDLTQSQVTTHILDTSIGKPAPDVAVSMFRMRNNEWQKMGVGRTNADGRLPDLLPRGFTLEKNNYKLIFDTAGYFSLQGDASFYPEVHIIFNIADESHYHVPLLLNPFGYSTYRGS